MQIKYDNKFKNSTIMALQWYVTMMVEFFIFITHFIYLLHFIQFMYEVGDFGDGLNFVVGSF